MYLGLQLFELQFLLLAELGDLVLCDLACLFQLSLPTLSTKGGEVTSRGKYKKYLPFLLGVFDDLGGLLFGLEQLVDVGSLAHLSKI